MGWVVGNHELAGWGGGFLLLGTSSSVLHFNGTWLLLKEAGFLLDLFPWAELLLTIAPNNQCCARYHVGSKQVVF